MTSFWPYLTFVVLFFVEISIGYQDYTKLDIKVGAFFFTNEKDVELSFDEGIRVVNNLKFFELNFITVKRYLADDDSFVLHRLTCEMISSGVAAIFGPSSKTTSDIVALLADKTGIPHLQYDIMLENPQQRRYNHRMSVNVAPTPSLIARAYWDIIGTNYEWRDFTVIYQTEEGLARLQNLLDIQTSNKDVIKLKKLSNYQSDYRVLWKEAEEIYHENRIVMDCDPNLLDSLMISSEPFKLLGPFKSWFLTNLNTHNSRLRDVYSKAFRANITSVRIKVADPNPYERKRTKLRRVDEIFGNQTMLPILIYDAIVLFANSARNVIRSLNQRYQAPSQRCDLSSTILDHPWPLGHEIVAEMKNISEDDVEPNFKTERMKFDELGQRSEIHLELFKPTVNEPLAIWKPDGTITPITASPVLKVSTQYQDFSQERKVYTVATKFGEPYFMLKEDHENFRGIEKYEGYAVDLIQKLSELSDFEYNFMIVDKTGTYNAETEEWDGIIRKLIDHQAQIGICDLTITQSRRQVVDFTVPFMQLGISILFYKSPPAPKYLFAFLNPFATQVWIFLVVTMFIMVLLFIFMARISPQEWINPNPRQTEPDELENIWNMSNSSWLTLGSIMQQGCDILPRGPPMRILSSLWWFFALMMVNTYTANLAAFLTSNKMQISINGLSDLIDQNEVKFGTVEGGSTSLFFSESNQSDYQKAWNQMKTFKPSVFTKDNAEGVSRVLKEEGKYAFLMETTGMSYNIERHCNLQEIGQQIGEKHYGIAVPLGAAYRGNLSVSILDLSEKGELNRLKKKWWKNHNVTCEKMYEVDGDELSIIELGGVFLVLGGGIFVALILGTCQFLRNVQRVAARQRITPGEAFKAEVLFALKFWTKRKPSRISTFGSSKSRMSTSHRSSGQSGRTHTCSESGRSTSKSRERSRKHLNKF